MEGQNLHIDYRWAGGVPEKLSGLADELVRLKVDIFIAPVTQVIEAAKRATRDIPIIMVAANDPIADGFVVSLARPAGNITGLTFEPDLEIAGKHIELLVQVIPHLSRVAVLVNPQNRAHKLVSEPIRAAAHEMGVKLHFFEARRPDEINVALMAASKGRPGALLIQTDALFFGQRQRIADFAVRNRLPTIYSWREGAEAGGLMTYGASLTYNFRRAGSFVDRILKGAKPGDLPVERPAEVELVINLKTAKALRLTIPPSLLARADQVIG